MLARSLPIARKLHGQRYPALRRTEESLVRLERHHSRKPSRGPAQERASISKKSIFVAKSIFNREHSRWDLAAVLPRLHVAQPIEPRSPALPLRL